MLTASQGAAGAEQTRNLADLSLEQLGDIEITSVSKREQRLGDAPASIYVITREAIQRAGVNTLAEALRLAPNLQVARINASQYAISARGFNAATANKLLVLVDGRSVYTPLYSGVFWETQDVSLSDIERIEVISGPGGTLWGANAVNGVINVITTSARNSVGTQAQAAAGNLSRAVSLRQGWRWDDGGALRAYAKYNKRRDSERASGIDANDGFEKLQLGFRADADIADGALTLQGDAYKQAIEQTNAADQRHHGANLLARWARSLDGGAALNLQGYVDRSWRDVPGSYTENLRVLDLDLQYLLAAGESSQWTLGGGYRQADDVVGSYGVLAFLPASRRLHWANVFAQYERTLSSATTLTLGARAEHNSYSGVEWMPSARLGWKLSPQLLLWSAVSRAVRTPSRTDVELFSPPQPPYLLAGGPGFRSEIANTLEAGLRAQPTETLSYSLTLFGSRYTSLRNYRRISATANTFILINAATANVYGVEAWGRWQVLRGWALQAGLTAMHERFSGAGILSIAPGNDPPFQARLQSSWSLADGVDLDMSLRRVGGLRYTSVPAYNEADARLGWRISERMEVALSGRNLLHAQHREFPQSGAAAAANPVMVGRTVQLTLTVRP
ncbi:iron complex outermembrane receptor protein [Pelomonas saccharophila]|uniref:Iron complex outermembrane receptor protein n=1 Tax=Roseateles saccharophilus TaxID=304 RepID=A0ABU1YIM1_ROSSA|nr:TonB-dependent receptor [Roseateles saccharophilus]MDR7268673.1 iron complex outermembrane receptor protein [Roseateles saccharophilus]